MKNISFRRILAALGAAAMLFSLAGCGYDEIISSDTEDFYLTRDAEMDEATKSALEEITTYFEAYMANADAETVKPYLSADFGTSDEQLTQFAQYYLNLGASPFAVYDTYYIKNVKPDTITRRFKKSADAATAIEVTPGADEMYTVLYASENENISHMVTLLCAKDSGKWKIVWIDASDFKYNNQDAPALFKRGGEYSDAGNLAAAYVTALKLNLIMRPGNALVYADTDLMEDFYYQISDKFAEAVPMPYTPSDAADTLKLHAVALANEGGEIIPLMIMQTASDLSDTDALRAEAASLRRVLEAVSPGFSAEFPKIAVNAVNADPTTTENPQTASFVLE